MKSIAIHIKPCDHTLAVLAFAVLFYLKCYQVRGCDDVSSQACHDMMSQNEDLCNDACLSSVCLRTCGKCALKCYSCHEVDKLNNCNTTTECPSNEHQCISVKSFNSDFKEVYKLGCALGTICDSPGLETSCCTSDLCNNHRITTTKTTTTTKIPTTTTTTTTTQMPSTTTTTTKIPTTLKTTTWTTTLSPVLLVGKRQHIDPFCVENSPIICQDLIRSDPSSCSKDCIMSMCPVSCGKCKTCYNCPYVADSELCNMTTLCKHDEFCYGLETVNSYKEHGFRLGCAPQAVCDSIATISTNNFGRRSQRALVGGCCSKNLCNTHIKPLTTTKAVPMNVRTTPKPSTTAARTTVNSCQCPKHAFTYKNDCFFVSNATYTRMAAKSFCQTHCANLARFDSTDELNDIERQVRNYIRNSNHRRFILDTYPGFAYMSTYIDAIYDTRRHWIWESTGDRISHALFRNQTVPKNSVHECAVSAYLFRSHISPIDCNSLHPALCRLESS
ncbi:uncharacterized protein LOC134239052 [Saccostrea cucullata]|uniref:uncharacterized protein LOC134239052 n=1 Tax=Saccostrea cuccullata TaxID=36930 RepID=UPI002ED34914